MSDVRKDPAAAGSGRYALIAIVLHWTIAALILLQIILAGRMEDRSPEAFAVTQLHKSVGITILLLSLARLGWRLANPPPPMPDTMARWEKTLAAITHGLFYVIMIGMPLTGWLMVSTSRIEIPTLLFGVIPWPDLPGLDGLSLDVREDAHDFGEDAHSALIKVFYGLAALHVAGALKHQLFSRDEPVLSRMAPGAKAGRWLEPRLLAIALAAAAVTAFGFVVTPPAGVRAPAAVSAEDDEPLEAAGPGEAVVAAPAAGAETAALDQEFDKVPAEPVTWRVDDGSELEFETAWGDAKIEGAFRRWDAEIAFSPAALDRSRVRISIDLASVTTGDRQRDEALPGYDFFNVDEHPRAVFTATRFTRTDDENFVAHGQLAMRGVTRPVSLPFRLQMDEDKARVRGVTSLDRTAFGVGQGEWANTEQIPAKVTVRVDLRASR